MSLFKNCSCWPFILTNDHISSVCLYSLPQISSILVQCRDVSESGHVFYGNSLQFCLKITKRDCVFCGTSLHILWYTWFWDFHDDNDIKECMIDNSFSVFNCSIRSLSGNDDSLQIMLSELHFPVSVIGLIETKLECNQNLIAKARNGSLWFYISTRQNKCSWSWFLYKKPVKIFTSVWCILFRNR